MRSSPESACSSASFRRRLLFLRERGERSDADDRPVQNVSELVRAQDDIKRLIPRDVAHGNVHGATHGGIDDDVQAADLGEHAQHGAEVCAFELQADRGCR